MLGRSSFNNIYNIPTTINVILYNIHMSIYSIMILCNNKPNFNLNGCFNLVKLFYYLHIDEVLFGIKNVVCL